MGLICVLVELDLDLEIVDIVLYVTVSGLYTSLITVTCIRDVNTG